MKVSEAIKRAGAATRDRLQGPCRAWSEDEAEGAAADCHHVRRILQEWRAAGRHGPVPIYETRYPGHGPNPKLYLGCFLPDEV
jgi:hypothetical protein